jgi:predicted AAA+ superfamily ATPase
MNCEYKTCNKPASKVFLGTRFCTIDYQFVKEQFFPFHAGRKHSVHLERIADWIKKKEEVAISTTEVTKEFGITYPTAQDYLQKLEKIKIIKFDGGGIWIIIEKMKEIQKK